MTSGMLNEEDWRWVQGALPVLCVDVVPIRFDQRADVLVGLIRRETPHQGQRWCFVGGRVRRGEALREALAREWVSALGDDCAPGAMLRACPLVVEYRPDSTPGRPHDPRKHAVGLTYAVEAVGDPRASGVEAIDFRWFDPAELNANVMGFGQETVIPDVVDRVKEIRMGGQ